MNTIATINDFLLSVVLFIIYFIFASVIRYNLKEKTSPEATKISVQDSEESLKPFTYKDAFSIEFDPDPIEEISASVQSESVKENVVPVVTQKAITQSSSPITAENRQSIPEIIDRLGKRELRKLCSPLGIQQKTNGTELTTELMKALVKRKFKENPLQVTQVIGVHLPNLLPTLPESNQQQLDSLAC